MLLCTHKLPHGVWSLGCSFYPDSSSDTVVTILPDECLSRSWVDQSCPEAAAILAKQTPAIESSALLAGRMSMPPTYGMSAMQQTRGSPFSPTAYHIWRQILAETVKQKAAQSNGAAETGNRAFTLCITVSVCYCHFVSLQLFVSVSVSASTCFPHPLLCSCSLFKGHSSTRKHTQLAPWPSGTNSFDLWLQQLHITGSAARLCMPLERIGQAACSALIQPNLRTACCDWATSTGRL